MQIPWTVLPSTSIFWVLIAILFTILSPVSYPEFFLLPGSTKPQGFPIATVIALTQLPTPYPMSVVFLPCPLVLQAPRGNNKQNKQTKQRTL